MIHFWWMVLNIVIVIILLYLAFSILDVIFVTSFLSIFKKHQKAMVILINVKYDNLVNLWNCLEKNGAKFDDRIKNALVEVQRNSFDEPETALSKKAQDLLTYIREELVFLSRQIPGIENSEEYMAAKENLAMIDNQYRNNVAMYNADVLGYNYWIWFWPTRWIWLMFGFKKKELIMN